MTWRIRSLPASPFEPMFALDEDALLALGARRMTAAEPNVAPCRVSLTDAAVGETLVLASHWHVADPASPYRASGAVFMREGAQQARPAPGELAEMLTRRLLSVRAYDAAWMMVEAEVVEGVRLGEQLDAWFGRPQVREVHVHTARRGCYLAAVERA
jgi:hypothetical protein